MITNTASPLSEWNSLIHRICFVLTWELTGEDRWLLGSTFSWTWLLLSVGVRALDSRWVGLCSVSSQATIREELLQEMEAAGARLSFTPA